LEIAERPAGTRIVSSNGALVAGSSKQGKARRALVASNCVTPSQRFEPSAATYLLR
jgi:hypothetical protein